MPPWLAHPPATRLVLMVGGLVALVGDAVAVVGGPRSFVKVVLRPVQRRGAAGQPGLGRLQRCLRLLGARLCRPDPRVVGGQGDPLALGLLDDLWARSATFRDDDLARVRNCWNASSGVNAWVATRTPLACSTHTRLVSALRSCVTSASRTASSTPVRTSSAVTTANAPNASTSSVDQARGWVAYTFSVPTGWLASRTGTLNTPHTRSWATTAAICSQTRSLRRSSTATTRSSAYASRHGPSPKSCWTCSSSSIAASDTATHRGRPCSWARVNPAPSTPTTAWSRRSPAATP
jgi:hypothetical protein